MAHVRQSLFAHEIYYKNEHCYTTDEVINNSATLGRSQDVCKGARFPIEGERCVVSSLSLFKRLEVNGEEEDNWTRLVTLKHMCSNFVGRKGVN